MTLFTLQYGILERHKNTLCVLQEPKIIFGAFITIIRTQKCVEFCITLKYYTRLRIYLKNANKNANNPNGIFLLTFFEVIELRLKF